MNIFFIVTNNSNTVNCIYTQYSFTNGNFPITYKYFFYFINVLINNVFLHGCLISNKAILKLSENRNKVYKYTSANMYIHISIINIGCVTITETTMYNHHIIIL